MPCGFNNAALTSLASKQISTYGNCRIAILGQSATWAQGSQRLCFKCSLIISSRGYGGSGLAPVNWILGREPLEMSFFDWYWKVCLLLPTTLHGGGRLTLSHPPGKYWWGCRISQFHSGCQASLVCPLELSWKRAVAMQLIPATWRRALHACPGGFLACRRWPIGHLLGVLETWMWLLLCRMPTAK